MKTLESLIESTHVGYNQTGISGYAQAVQQYALTEQDVAYAERVIAAAVSGDTSDYDSFPDAGGINLAAYLLEEVKKYRAIMAAMPPPPLVPKCPPDRKPAVLERLLQEARSVTESFIMETPTGGLRNGFTTLNLALMQAQGVCRRIRTTVDSLGPTT